MPAPHPRQFDPAVFAATLSILRREGQVNTDNPQHWPVVLAALEQAAQGEWPTSMEPEEKSLPRTLSRLCANLSNLSIVSYAAGFTQWVYRTERTRREVEVSGYFNDMTARMNFGDLIHIIHRMKGREGISDYVVKAVGEGIVLIENIRWLSLNPKNLDF